MSARDLAVAQIIAGLTTERNGVKIPSRFVAGLAEYLVDDMEITETDALYKMGVELMIAAVRVVAGVKENDHPKEEGQRERETRAETSGAPSAFVLLPAHPALRMCRATCDLWGNLRGWLLYVVCVSPPTRPGGLTAVDLLVPVRAVLNTAPADLLGLCVCVRV